MDKDEIIDLHLLLYLIREQVEEQQERVRAEAYETLGIEPWDRDRSQSEHEAAVFALGKALASSLSPEEFVEPSSRTGIWGRIRSVLKRW